MNTRFAPTTLHPGARALRRLLPALALGAALLPQGTASAATAVEYGLIVAASQDALPGEDVSPGSLVKDGDTSSTLARTISRFYEVDIHTVYTVAATERDPTVHLEASQLVFALPEAYPEEALDFTEDITDLVMEAAEVLGAPEALHDSVHCFASARRGRSVEERHDSGLACVVTLDPGPALEIGEASSDGINAPPDPKFTDWIHFLVESGQVVALADTAEGDDEGINAPPDPKFTDWIHFLVESGQVVTLAQTAEGGLDELSGIVVRLVPGAGINAPPDPL